MGNKFIHNSNADDYLDTSTKHNLNKYTYMVSDIDELEKHAFTKRIVVIVNDYKITHDCKCDDGCCDVINQIRNGCDLEIQYIENGSNNLVSNEYVHLDDIRYYDAVDWKSTPDVRIIKKIVTGTCSELAKVPTYKTKSVIKMYV